MSTKYVKRQASTHQGIICGACGQQCKAGDNFCIACGTTLPKEHEPPVSVSGTSLYYLFGKDREREQELLDMGLNLSTSICALKKGSLCEECYYCLGYRTFEEFFKYYPHRPRRT